MNEQFYNILTNVGKAQIANSNVLGNKINFVKFKVGDGGGKYYNPTPEQQDLINTVWEGAINSIFIDENNSNWIVVQTIIPTNVGGFMIREAAVFDGNDNMIAVGKYPETYKPIFSEGSAKDLIIKIIFEVSNAENVTLKVDPTVTLATKNDIKVLETKMLGMLEKHSLNINHVYYCGESEGENNIYQVNPGSAPNLQEGLAISIKAHRDSTAECKCVYKNSTQISILKSNGKPIRNFKKGGIYTLRYDGVNFMLQGEGASGDAKPSDLLSGKTAESNNGELVGTIPIKSAQTYVPSTVNQLISAGQYLGGNQTIKGDSNLNPDNLAKGVEIFGVLGTGKTDLDKMFEVHKYDSTIDEINNTADFPYIKPGVPIDTIKIALIYYAGSVGVTDVVIYIKNYGFWSLTSGDNIQWDNNVSSTGYILWLDSDNNRFKYYKSGQKTRDFVYFT